MVIQVYALSSNTEEAEVERFYEDLQDLLELTPKKRWSVRLTKLPKWHPVISLAPVFSKLRDHQILDLWLRDILPESFSWVESKDSVRKGGHWFS